MVRRTLAVAIVALLAFATLDTIISGTERAGDGTFVAAEFPDRRLSIMAPADPGGGWDETARALQQSIRETKLAPGAEVYNVGGAGGTLGLSQLVAKESGQPYELMVMGLVMLGAIETNQSAVGLDEVTPIAALTSEPEIIVVPAKSKFQTLDDVLAAMKADPGSVSWGGGSAGGTDQLLVGLLAQATEVEPKATRYVAYSGGGEATTGILSGSVDVGVSGVNEFEDQIAAGKMRALAVSTPKGVTVAGKPVKSIKEQGTDVEILNWRGIVAPPDITEEERATITRWVERLRRTPSWTANEKRFGWTRFGLSGAAFRRYIDSEQARVKTLVAELGIAG